jgi:hypothetical protein
VTRERDDRAVLRDDGVREGQVARDVAQLVVDPPRGQHHDDAALAHLGEGSANAVAHAPLRRDGSVEVDRQHAELHATSGRDLVAPLSPIGERRAGSTWGLEKVSPRSYQ